MTERRSVGFFGIAASRALSLPLVGIENDPEDVLPAAPEDRRPSRRCGEPWQRSTFSHLRQSQRPHHDRRTPGALTGLAERDLWLIEDDPIGPLAPAGRSLSQLSPRPHLQHRPRGEVLALGLRVGMLTAPAPAHPLLAAALRASTWLTAPLLGEVLAHWIRDGVAEQIARDEGILPAPGDDYVVDRTRPAHEIRVGLNAEMPDNRLRPALTTLMRWLPLGPTAS